MAGNGFRLPAGKIPTVHRRQNMKSAAASCDDCDWTCLDEASLKNYAADNHAGLSGHTVRLLMEWEQEVVFNMKEETDHG
jgi:hypothetical protein